MVSFDRKEWYSKTLEHRRKIAKKWRESNVNKTLLHSARKRSKTKSIPFDIDENDIVVPDICPILQVPLRINQLGDRTHNNYSPTLDRIIPDVGYVKGNVWVISHKANVMKNNASTEELIRFAEWINRHVMN